MPVCAICKHLSLPPRVATGTVGLMTDEASMLDGAIDRLGTIAGEQHILVHACPEHVVDVYRGRIAGMRMAWKLSDNSFSPLRQSPAATSASPA